MPVLAFFGTAVGRYVLIGVAVLGLLLGMRFHWVSLGVKQERTAEASRLEAEQARVKGREQSAAAISIAALGALGASQKANEIRTRTLVQKVTVYVPAKADADCRVPRGFVMLHDAAAQGGPASLPSAAGGSVEAASGVPLSAALETVIGNYGVAYDWRAEAMSWRSWYAKQAAAWK